MFKRSIAMVAAVFAAAAASIMGKDAMPENLLDLRGYGGGRRGSRHGEKSPYGNCKPSCWFHPPVRENKYGFPCGQNKHRHASDMTHRGHKRLNRAQFGVDNYYDTYSEHDQATRLRLIGGITQEAALELVRKLRPVAKSKKAA